MIKEIITLEEHFTTERCLRESEKLNIEQYRTKNLSESGISGVQSCFNENLLDLDKKRLEIMNKYGITMQVLQFSSHHLDKMETKIGNEIFREANDMIGELIKSHPTRFSGFANLNLKDVNGAVYELERGVTKLGLKGAAICGKFDNKFIDNEKFRPILEAASILNVPIYIHPGEPSKEIMNLLYSDLPPVISARLSRGGWGWHMETCLQGIRLILSGIFDIYPNLQIILGHLGEGIPFILDRLDTRMTPVANHLERRVKDYIRSNFYITPSGFFSKESFLCALSIFSPQRIMMSVDYPYTRIDKGIDFINSMEVGQEDFDKITYKNAQQLLCL